jgi:hypothetical protein
VRDEFADRIGLSGLGEDFDGAGFHARQRGLAALGGERADDDHGHGVMLHQAAQEREPVHAGHLDVEREHIGLEGEDLVARHVRVGRGADDRDAGLLAQLVAEHAPNQRGIVDDQHSDVVRHDQTFLD